MPHLSPMKWKLMALLVLMTMALTSISSWWSQLPNYPLTHSSNSFNNSSLSNQWPWY